MVQTGQITLANLLGLADVTDKPMAWFLPGYSEDQEADDDADALSLVLDRLDEKQLERLLSDVLSAKLTRAER